MNGNEQVGVQAGSFYTIESVSNGGRVDEQGNTAATQLGTYQAELKKVSVK